MMSFDFMKDFCVGICFLSSLTFFGSMIIFLVGDLLGSSAVDHPPWHVYGLFSFIMFGLGLMLSIPDIVGWINNKKKEVM